MSDQSRAPEPEGTEAESDELVTGEGGPAFSQAGMEPGGSEMEGWKQPSPGGSQDEASIEEQAENLRNRVEGS